MEDLKHFFRFRAFWAIILLSLLFRGGALSTQWEVMVNPDGYDYVNIAQSIVDGKGFAFKTSDPNIVFREYMIDNADSVPEYKTTAWRPPLYCFFLSVFVFFGIPIWGIQLFQMLLSTVTVALVMGLTFKISHSNKKAWLAGIALCLNPYSAFLATAIGTECLHEFLIVSLLCSLFFVWKYKRKWYLPGIVFGLIVLCRPGTGLLCFFLFIPLVIFRFNH